MKANESRRLLGRRNILAFVVLWLSKCCGSHSSVDRSIFLKIVELVLSPRLILVGAEGTKDVGIQSSAFISEQLASFFEMFSRLSAVSLAVLALPLLAAASVVPRESTNTTVSWGKCNTGSAQCCKSVQDVRFFPPRSDSN